MLLTLGLFTLVINGLMLWLACIIATQLGFGVRVDGLVPALLGALVISILSFVLSVLTGVNREEHHRRR